MELESQEQVKKRGVNVGIILAILIGAWVIGISILGAGYLITKEIAQQSRTNQNASAIAEPQNIEVPAGIPVLGDNNAKVTIVEFADFQCPFCGEWQQKTFPRLKQEFIDSGKARFIYMDFPFLGQESIQAALAARCAMDQGKFWEYHDKLFVSQNGENQGAFADKNLKTFAAELQLDMHAFNACLDTKAKQDLVEGLFSKGSEYNVTSTPTIFIDGHAFEGVLPYNQYKQFIESQLAK